MRRFSKVSLYSLKWTLSAIAILSLGAAAYAQVVSNVSVTVPNSTSLVVTGGGSANLTVASNNWTFNTTNGTLTTTALTTANLTAASNNSTGVTVSIQADAAPVVTGGGASLPTYIHFSVGSIVNTVGSPAFAAVAKYASQNAAGSLDQISTSGEDLAASSANGTSTFNIEVGVPSSDAIPSSVAVTAGGNATVTQTLTLTVAANS